MVFVEKVRAGRDATLSLEGAVHQAVEETERIKYRERLTEN